MAQGHIEHYWQAYLAIVSDCSLNTYLPFAEQFGDHPVFTEELNRLIAMGIKIAVCNGEHSSC